MYSRRNPQDFSKIVTLVLKVVKLTEYASFFESRLPKFYVFYVFHRYYSRLKKNFGGPFVNLLCVVYKCFKCNEFLELCVSSGNVALILGEERVETNRYKISR